jgi:hypothetical protein
VGEKTKKTTRKGEKKSAEREREKKGPHHGPHIRVHTPRKSSRETIPEGEGEGEGRAEGLWLMGVFFGRRGGWFSLLSSLNEKVLILYSLIIRILRSTKQSAHSKLTVL